jgi:hypothetical protein
MDKIVDTFLSNPENYILFRGEKPGMEGGLHFTLDKEWAKVFGSNILQGYLPQGSKIKIISEEDFEEAMKFNISTDYKFYYFIFAKGYDAILGYDPMNSQMLDIIVNPKLLKNFRVS